MLFNKKFPKINKISMCFISFMILMIILLYILYKKSDREDYINYFLPYYNQESNDAYDFYKMNRDQYNQTKKSFITQPLSIGIDEKSGTDAFIKQLGSMLVAKSFIQNVIYMLAKTEYDLMFQCNNRKVDIVNCANPLISSTYGLTNLRFICNTNKMYLYILSKEIESLRDLAKHVGRGRNCVISIDYPNSVAHLFCKDLMTTLGYSEDRGDYSIRFGGDFFETPANAYKMAIMALPFHPKEFEKRCCTGNIFFLPFELENETKTNVFFTKNFYYIRDIYDLNDICPSYLPKKYGGKTYTRFSAQIPIVSYYNTLICHDRVSDDMIYQILRTFYENIGLFNQLPVFHKTPLYKTQLNAGPQNAIPINNGAKRFFVEKGYITMESNESCKYLVGVEACNFASLEKHGFTENGKELDAIFRFH